MDDTVPATADVAGELDIAACEEYFQGRALEIFVTSALSREESC